MAQHAIPVTGMAPAVAARAASALDAATRAGLLALLAWLPLPLGTHRPWAVLLVVLAIAVLWCLWCLSRALPGLGSQAPDRATWLVFALWLLWLAWIAIQTWTLPEAWIGALSPHRLEQIQTASAILGRNALSATSLSLDRDLTQSAWLLSAAYAALFVLIVTLMRRRRHLRWLLWAVALSALAQALYGSLMTLSGLEYGAWGTKTEYRGYATGTFVNRNHFAGYLELGVAALLGLILASPLPQESRRGWRQHLRYWLNRAQDRRLFARVGIGVLFIALLLSQSRMGNVAAIGGLCVAVSTLILLRPRRRRAVGALLLIGSVVLIDIWLFGRWFGLDELTQRYAQVETDVNVRLAVLQDVQGMIPVYARGGSGLGTFALAYPEFRSAEIRGFVDHAHNDYAQFLVETGVPGALLVAALALATAVRASIILRRRRDPLTQGVAAAGLAALASLGIHGAADFNLQIPANAATLVALMAAVWACSTQGSGRRRGTGA